MKTPPPPAESAGGAFAAMAAGLGAVRVGIQHEARGIVERVGTKRTGRPPKPGSEMLLRDFYQWAVFVQHAGKGYAAAKKSVAAAWAKAFPYEKAVGSRRLDDVIRDLRGQPRRAAMYALAREAGLSVRDAKRAARDWGPVTAVIASPVDDFTAAILRVERSFPRDRWAFRLGADGKKIGYVERAGVPWGPVDSDASSRSTVTIGIAAKQPAKAPKQARTRLDYGGKPKRN